MRLVDLPDDLVCMIISRYLSGRDAHCIAQCCSSLLSSTAALPDAYVNTLVLVHGPYRFARYRPDRVPAGDRRAAVALALARSYRADGTDGLSLGFCSRHGLWDVWHHIIDQGAIYSQSRADLQHICTEQVGWRLMGSSVDDFLKLVLNTDISDPDWHKAISDLIQDGFQWDSSIFYHGDLEHSCDLHRQHRRDLLQFMLEHGADPARQPNRSDLSPLLAISSSTRSGQCHGPGIQSILLLHGADPDQICCSNGMTALQIACARSHIDIVHDLIQAGARLHHTGLCSGLTPLHHVANCLRPEAYAVVHLLVENGADINPLDDDGLTPMHYAATRDNDAVVQALCELGYDLVDGLKPSSESESGTSSANPWSPTFFAVVNRSDRVLRLMLARGESPGRTGPHGKSLLHAAVECQNIGACHILLAAGAAVNQTDHYGMTPLSSAVYRHFADCAHLLLDHGAHVNIDILHAGARLSASADLMAALVRVCHDPDVADAMGKTALMYAARFGNAGSVQALIHAGVDIDRADRSGFTALFYARAYGNHDVEDLLLAAGATKERLNNKRLKLLFCSGTSGCPDQADRSIVY